MNKQDFKAWDPSDKKMLSVGEFELYYDEDNGLNSGHSRHHSQIGQSSVRCLHRNKVQILQLKKEQAWEGDLRSYKGKLYILVNDVWQWRLERSVSWADDNDQHVVGEDVIFESILFGNIYQNPERCSKP